MRTRVLSLLTLFSLVGFAAAQPARNVVLPEAPPIHLAPVVPPSLKLLTQPAVQSELGLKATQKESVLILTEAWKLPPRVWEGSAFGITPEIGRAVIEAHTKAFLESELTKEQRTRLDQIVFQLREREFGAYAAFAMSARDLRLRSDQVEDLSNIKGLRIEEIAKHVTSGERYEKIKERVTATNGDTFEKMAEMLSKSQRERLWEMRGKDFAGKVDWSAIPKPEIVKRPTPPAAPPKSPQLVELLKTNRPLPGYRVLLTSYPPALYGVYDLELRYLATSKLRDELKVTTEQGKKLDSALESWAKAHLELPGLDLVRAGQLHEQTAKAIDDILNPDQKKRLGEIMMRRRLLVSVEAMCGHPAAVAALKLTPNQLNELKEGQSLDAVLTKEQGAAVKDLAGKPFDIPKGVVDPLLSFHAPLPVPDPVADRPQVALAPRQPVFPPAYARDFLIISDRLKLSDKQIARLRELAEDEPKIMELIQKELDFADTPPVIGAGRSLTSANAVTGKFKAAIDEQCWNVLDAQQQSTARRLFGRGR